MPPHTSYYNGDYEIIHTVQRGESLSSIATKYKFRSWQPIWIYNTQKEHMLAPDSDPDSLQVGQRLFIPRSKEGYEKLLKKLEALKLGLESSGEAQKYILDGLKNEYKAEEVLFDLGGDIATFLGSLSIKALEVAKLRRATVGLKGAQRFAAEIQLKKGAADLAAAVSTKELKKTAMDGAAGWASSKLADGDEADYVQKTSTFTVKTYPKLTTAISEFKSRQKLGAALKKVVGGSMQSLLDVTDIALDYVKVSKVANAYLWLAHGETVEDSFERANGVVESSVTRGLSDLHAKILKFQKESFLLYHTAPPATGKLP